MLKKTRRNLKPPYCYLIHLIKTIYFLISHWSDTQFLSFNLSSYSSRGENRLNLTTMFSVKKLKFLVLLLNSVLCLTLCKNLACNVSDEYILVKGKSADVVLTAIIDEVFLPSPDGTYSVKMRIKRVYKGLNDTRYDRSIVVDGFGTERFCESGIRVKDTRIFFIENREHGHLRLNGSLIRMTLSNLDVAYAAVSGKFFLHSIFQTFLVSTFVTSSF